MNNKTILLFFFLAFCFGGSFAAVKFVISDLPPVFGAFCRIATATFFLSFILRPKGKSLRVPRHLYVKVWTCGLFLQGIPLSLIFYAQQVVPSGVSGIFSGTVPLWTQCFAFFLLPGKEPLTRKKIAGLLVGALGIIMIFYDKIHLGGNHQLLWGLLAMLTAVSMYGLGAAYNSRLIHRDFNADFYGSLFQQHLFAMFFLAILAGILEGPSILEIKSISWQAIGAILLLGFFSNAVAWRIFFYLTKNLGAVRTSSVTYLVPIVALILDILIFGRSPTVLEEVGVLVIFLGMFLIQSSISIIVRPAANSTGAHP